MKTSASARHLSLSLLLLSVAGATFAAVPTAEPTAQNLADKFAAHPTFTVRVVGKGPPMMQIPGLNCPGVMWDVTVAHYQTQYRCHIISLAGFGGMVQVTMTDPPLPAQPHRARPYRHRSAQRP